MFDNLLAILAPHVCLSCGVEGALWCATCRGSTPFAADCCYKCHSQSNRGRTCAHCRHTSPLYGVQAAAPYRGDAKQLIWQLKFERAKAGASDAAALMATRVAIPTGILVVPVPAVTSHVRRRGYDQSVLIARCLARAVGATYSPALMRLGQTQQRNASRAQRLSQLAGAFRVTRPDQIAGAQILLVDDVVTTGATLEAAARTLKAAGARRVSAAVFAQA